MWNNNSKGSKNYEYSINSGFTEKLGSFIIGRWVLTLPILWRPSYIAHHLFQSLSNLQLPLLILLSCLFHWMGDHATFDILFYLIILWIYKCQASVPWYHDVCFMQQGVKFTEVWHIIWFFTSLWFDTTQTHKQRHIAHSGVNWLTHPYKYILTPPVMCSQQLCALHWMNNLLISKFCFP